MDCQRFIAIIEELERDLPLTASARTQGLQHAENCPSCRGRLAEARLLSLHLRALARDDEHLRAPGYLEVRLAAAFREGRQRSSSQWRRLAWGGGVAAMALGMWLVWAHVWQKSAPQAGSPNPRPAGPIITTPAVMPQIVADDVQHLRGDQPAPRQRRRLHSRATPAQAQPGAADGFVALPYGDGVYPVGDGMMVRVQLPRSAPALVGYPTAPTPDALGSVTADVVLGQDGVARAIRFVPSEREGPGRNQNLNSGIIEGEPQ